MAGQQTLDLRVEVRVLIGQQNVPEQTSGIFFITKLPIIGNTFQKNLDKGSQYV